MEDFGVALSLHMDVVITFPQTVQLMCNWMRLKDMIVKGNVEAKKSPCLLVEQFLRVDKVYTQALLLANILHNLTHIGYIYILF